MKTIFDALEFAFIRGFLLLRDSSRSQSRLLPGAGLLGSTLLKLLLTTTNGTNCTNEASVTFVPFVAFVVVIPRPY